MSPLQLLLGQPALSDFRLSQLLPKIQAKAPHAKSLSAHWVYLVRAADAACSAPHAQPWA